MRVNSGSDQQALAMAGGLPGDTGTSTAVAATSLTDTTKAWTTNAWAGALVTTGAVYGVVISNTGTVLTVDRWSAPATPGSTTAATTPGTGAYFVGGGAPSLFMALTANATAPAATDTALTGELAAANGGLTRKLATYAHTTGTATYTLTAVFVANSSDALPVTVAKVGIFNSMVPSAGRLMFEDLLTPSTAPFNAIGDQSTVTATLNI